MSVPVPCLHFFGQPLGLAWSGRPQLLSISRMKPSDSNGRPRSVASLKRRALVRSSPCSNIFRHSAGVNADCHNFIDSNPLESSSQRHGPRRSTSRSPKRVRPSLCPHRKRMSNVAMRISNFELKRKKNCECRIAKCELKKLLSHRQRIANCGFRIC